MNNIYYSPEEFGLETIADINMAGSYEFDICVVWQEKSTGRLLMGTDSGCSCPTPFEDMGLDELTRITSTEPLYAWLNGHYNRGNRSFTKQQDFVRKVQAALMAGGLHASV